MKLARYTELQEKVQKLQQRRDRAQGALDQVMERLRKEYGCKTIKEAKTLLAKLNTDLDESEQEFETLLTTFEKEYGDLLDE